MNYKVCVILFWTIEFSWCIKWLAKDVFGQRNWTKEMCLMAKFHFNKKQRSTCLRNIDLMKYVSKGAEMATEECIEQFNSRQWNCLSIYLAPRYGRDLTNATKESAVVYALSSAALVLSTAMDCARGIVRNCGCTGVQNHVLFYDHACDPVLNRAISFAREFTMPGKKKLQRIRRKSPARAAKMSIQQHNRKVGWKVTQETNMIRCKCRGNTGECPMKICYKALPNFKDVGNELKLRYDRAVKVATSDGNIIVPNNIGYGRNLDRELIYSDNSVDKCGLTDLYISNRVCSLELDAENNCRKVCCHGRYKKKTILVLGSCNCKFEWCCEVVCDECDLKKEIYVCAET